MITLLSNTQALRKVVKDALAPTKVRARRVTARQAGRIEADAVVTTTSITSSVAKLAMRVGTGLIFVLPEAVESLTLYVAEHPDAVLAGNDIGKIDSLVRAEQRGGEQEVLL
ncbi:hypothetical protein [Pseudonocardia sp. NPDC049154]|uniref:hypothetical protein n=1 Tax=Pseudonocardia sp. NPDC049154 TaxID=3155501 RepID=UPI0033E2C3A9